MGTRNLTMVYKNGEYKVAQYGQFDGYPEGVGATLLNFLKSVNMDAFNKAIQDVSFYTAKEIDEINKSINEIRKELPNYSWKKHYPHLSRECGGDILNQIVFNGVNKVFNDFDFASDSIFCEWAYVIDLDTNKFEVYRGFNQVKLNKNERFYCLEEKSKNGYHPVKFVKSYDINNLPDENSFIADFESDDEEE